MRKTKEQKAITLIALIITIVVLLILAVVAINAVTGDGIIQHAVNAKTSYENAQAKEQGMISYYETYLETEGQVGKWIQNKTKVTRVNEDGTVDELEVGDTVDYKKADNTKYKDSNNNEITWKVLGAEDGKVLLVSATNVATETLDGAEDYINNTGINRLNAIGANYDAGIGAVEGSGRSIDVDDINRVTGYNPLKTGTGEPFYYYTNPNGKVTQYLNRVTYTINADGKVYYSSNLIEGVSSYEKFTNIDGTKLITEDEYEKSEIKDGIAKSITVDSTMYSYKPVSLSLDSSTIGEVKGISAESNAYELLFEGTEIEANKYWFGSSCVCADDGYVIFGVGYVSRGSVTAKALWKSYDGNHSYSYGVRAVVSLESNVQFIKTGENTYNISVTE